jgi:hypothetical protein
VPQAAQIINTDELLQQAWETVDEAQKLSGKIRRQRDEGRKRRAEAEARVTEAVGSIAERLWMERGQLELGLDDQMRRIHELEGSAIEFSEQRRHVHVHELELKRALRAATTPKEGERLDEDVRISLQDGIVPECRNLRAMGRRVKSNERTVKGELQRAYKEKQRTEVEIAKRQHAAALTEALQRARAERLRQQLQQAPSEESQQFAPASVAVDSPLSRVPAVSATPVTEEDEDAYR